MLFLQQNKLYEMTNKEIARKFNELAGLMELHEENTFKIRSYQNAYIQLRKLDKPLLGLNDDEITGIKGVGKAITGKIRELLDNGEMATLNKYQEMTPEGVREMLQIKGFGPKKIRVLWKNFGAETIGEVLYACNENRLIELKGFGKKTQEDLRQKLVYFLQSKNKFHFASLETFTAELLNQFQQTLPDAKLSLTGEMRRLCPIVEEVEYLIAFDKKIDKLFDAENIELLSQEGTKYQIKVNESIPVTVHHCKLSEFGSKLFQHSSNRVFLDAFLEKSKAKDFKGIETEEAVFEKGGIPFIDPTLRENASYLDAAINGTLPELIEETDIKGVLHTHTTYSDGLHTLEEMATAAKDLGYEYIGITDHSKAAFYANGLKEDRLMQQMAEIDELNKKLSPFKIFKGIESDILYDGSLDYEEAILKQFDFIIASVHSNLKMDEEKATQRLITAIENPYTTILGHPTGRLLLSREGYPINHKKVIDACAANGVVIELNANPYRLDLDWRWIPYALEKGVAISINPDAHSKEGIKDIHFGVCAAKKGGLTALQCLNAKGLTAFEDYLSRKVT